MGDWERWNAECKWCGEEYKGDICERLTHDFHCGGSSQFTPAAIDEIQSLRSQLTSMTERADKAEKERDANFLRGFAIAVSTLIHDFDRPTIAASIVQSNGLELSHFEDIDLPDGDLSRLRASLSHGGKL